MLNLHNIASDRPVLIAGPTASGKSDMALQIVEQSGGVIINADALQVYDNWHVLTARPTPEDQARAEHLLYGHIAFDTPYSVGDWLRDVMDILSGDKRPVIVGGTGLYFAALTEGLAKIPPTPAPIREAADKLLHEDGLDVMRHALDTESLERIDVNNPMRVQRAWEVLKATGRGLASWQDETPPPALPLSDVEAILIDAPKEWLNPRIEARFDQMLAKGALQEARANLDGWDPTRQSYKAIGAPELIAHLRGEMSLNEARDAAIIATRQYAKRQRTWFKSRMRDWRVVEATTI